MREVLFNPGPVMCDPRVHAAAAGVDACHREEEVLEALTATRAALSRLTSGDAAEGTAEDAVDTVVLTGSGTAAIEAVLAALPREARLLVADNGHYGERLALIAGSLGVHVDRLGLGWAERVSPGALAAAAERVAATHVALVHHETSTGMLNDVAGLARAARAAGAQVVVDAVSSIGCEPVDVVAWPVDWVAGSSNKCLEGLPGLGFVSARRELWHGLLAGPRSARGTYLDLATNAEAQIVRQEPAFTPAVNTLLALRAALGLLAQETVAGRRRRYGALTAQLREGLTVLGLELDLDPQDRATMLTSVRLPGGVPFRSLHAAMKERGFVVYGSQGRLSASRFRLATMGTITGDEIGRFLSALAEVLPALIAGSGPARGLRPDDTAASPPIPDRGR